MKQWQAEAGGGGYGMGGRHPVKAPGTGGPSDSSLHPWTGVEGRGVLQFQEGPVARITTMKGRLQERGNRPYRV